MSSSNTAGKPKFDPRQYRLAALVPVCAAVYYLAFWLRFEGQLYERGWQSFHDTVVWIVLTKLVVFGWFRIYHGRSRYATFHDLLSLLQAATCSSVLMALIDYLFFPYSSIPRSVFLMDWGATVVVIGGLRAIVRAVQERSFSFLASSGTSVFIVGANDSGEALLRAVNRSTNLSYRVVGFIDDSQSTGMRIAGVPVVGTLDQTCQLATQYGVSEIFISAEELSGKQVRRLVEDSSRHGFRVKVLPSYEQLLCGSVAIQPRPVVINDLLCRDAVQLDTEKIRHWIDGRVLMITGSAGSIGSEICRQLLQLAPSRIVLVDRSENGQFFLEHELRNLAPDRAIEVCIADITDTRRMKSIFAQHHPDIVFHAAAYKHVPLMEQNAGEAVKNIAVATRHLVDLAHEYAVSSFVTISTDKAVNPTSVMGACKGAAELYVQAMAAESTCRFVTVRFGNVLDSTGSVVPIFREQIAAGGPVTVTHPEMTRFFMTIPEASQLVIQAGAMGEGGEIFVLDMGEPVRIVDLAADMIRLSGLKVGEDIEIKFTGIRPGEKLFEELHSNGERRIATSHAKIMVAESETPDIATMRSAMDQLHVAAQYPLAAIVAELKKIMPSFHHDPQGVTPEERRAA